MVPESLKSILCQYLDVQDLDHLQPGQTSRLYTAVMVLTKSYVAEHFPDRKGKVPFLNSQVDLAHYISLLGSDGLLDFLSFLGLTCSASAKRHDLEKLARLYDAAQKLPFDKFTVDNLGRISWNHYNPHTTATHVSYPTVRSFPARAVRLPDPKSFRPDTFTTIGGIWPEEERHFLLSLSLSVASHLLVYLDLSDRAMSNMLVAPQFADIDFREYADGPPAPGDYLHRFLLTFMELRTVDVPKASLSVLMSEDVDSSKEPELILFLHKLWQRQQQRHAAVEPENMGARRRLMQDVTPPGYKDFIVPCRERERLLKILEGIGSQSFMETAVPELFRDDATGPISFDEFRSLRFFSIQDYTPDKPGGPIAPQHLTTCYCSVVPVTEADLGKSVWRGHFHVRMEVLNRTDVTRLGRHGSSHPSLPTASPRPPSVAQPSLSSRAPSASATPVGSVDINSIHHGRNSVPIPYDDLDYISVSCRAIDGATSCTVREVVWRDAAYSTGVRPPLMAGDEITHIGKSLLHTLLPSAPTNSAIDHAVSESDQVVVVANIVTHLPDTCRCTCKQFPYVASRDHFHVTLTPASCEVQLKTGNGSMDYGALQFAVKMASQLEQSTSDSLSFCRGELHFLFAVQEAIRTKYGPAGLDNISTTLKSSKHTSIPQTPFRQNSFLFDAAMTQMVPPLVDWVLRHQPAQPTHAIRSVAAMKEQFIASGETHLSLFSFIEVAKQVTDTLLSLLKEHNLLPFQFLNHQLPVTATFAADLPKSLLYWAGFVVDMSVYEGFFNSVRVPFFPLSVACEKALLPLIAATGHGNYTWACTSHLLRIMRLQHCPSALLREELLFGIFIGSVLRNLSDDEMQEMRNLLLSRFFSSCEDKHRMLIAKVIDYLCQSLPEWHLRWNPHRLSSEETANATSTTLQYCEETSFHHPQTRRIWVASGVANEMLRTFFQFDTNSGDPIGQYCISMFAQQLRPLSGDPIADCSPLYRDLMKWVPKVLSRLRNAIGKFLDPPGTAVFEDTRSSTKWSTTKEAVLGDPKHVKSSARGLSAKTTLAMTTYQALIIGIIHHAQQTLGTTIPSSMPNNPSEMLAYMEGTPPCFFTVKEPGSTFLRRTRSKADFLKVILTQAQCVEQQQSQSGPQLPPHQAQLPPIVSSALPRMSQDCCALLEMPDVIYKCDSRPKSGKRGVQLFRAMAKSVWLSTLIDLKSMQRPQDSFTLVIFNENRLSVTAAKRVTQAERNASLLQSMGSDANLDMLVSGPLSTPDFNFPLDAPVSPKFGDFFRNRSNTDVIAVRLIQWLVCEPDGLRLLNEMCLNVTRIEIIGMRDLGPTPQDATAFYQLPPNNQHYIVIRDRATKAISKLDRVASTLSTPDSVTVEDGARLMPLGEAEHALANYALYCNRSCFIISNKDSDTTFNFVLAGDIVKQNWESRQQLIYRKLAGKPCRYLCETSLVLHLQLSKPVDVNMSSGEAYAALLVVAGINAGASDYVECYDRMTFPKIVDCFHSNLCRGLTDLTSLSTAKAVRELCSPAKRDKLIQLAITPFTSIGTLSFVTSGPPVASALSSQSTGLARSASAPVTSIDELKAFASGSLEVAIGKYLLAASITDVFRKHVGKPAGSLAIDGVDFSGFAKCSPSMSALQQHSARVALQLQLIDNMCDFKSGTAYDHLQFYTARVAGLFSLSKLTNYGFHFDPSSSTVGIITSRDIAIQGGALIQVTRLDQPPGSEQQQQQPSSDSATNSTTSILPTISSVAAVLGSLREAREDDDEEEDEGDLCQGEDQPESHDQDDGEVGDQDKDSDTGTPDGDDLSEKPNIAGIEESAGHASAGNRRSKRVLDEEVAISDQLNRRKRQPPRDDQPNDADEHLPQVQFVVEYAKENELEDDWRKILDRSTVSPAGWRKDKSLQGMIARFNDKLQSLFDLALSDQNETKSELFARHRAAVNSALASEFGPNALDRDYFNRRTSRVAEASSIACEPTGAMRSNRRRVVKRPAVAGPDDDEL